MTKSVKKTDLSHFPVSAITVAGENDHLYERFGLANPDDYDLAISIRDKGIQEPLALSADHVLLSGHRRLMAARSVRMKTVPVRIVESINFASLSEAERLETLRLFNRQRDKTPGERIREKLLEIDPVEAHAELLNHRVKAVVVPGASKVNVRMGDTKKRAAITTLQFLEKVQEVIEDNEEYWPLTVRRVHYLLLNDPPLKHDKKPGSVYVNDQKSYKALTNLLIRARLSGDVPMESIEDETRPVKDRYGFKTAEQFIHQETDGFLLGYRRDLMQGQHHHFEIMLEKNALRTIVEKVASEYCIPCTTGRGFSSLTPRHEMAQRYRRSGKNKLVLLMLTDFDPDGDEIAASFARSLRDDFDITNIHPVKVALTAEDVRAYDLPSDMDAKVSSPNYAKFLQRYGSTKVVELDAAPVELLQSKLREAIERVIDVQAYNDQIDLERSDSAVIAAHRKVVIEAIKRQ